VTASGLLAPDMIDTAPVPGTDQPGGRVVRQAASGPLIQRGNEGLLQALLGQAEVVEQANQGRQHPPRLCAVDLFDLLPGDAVVAHGLVRWGRWARPASLSLELCAGARHRSGCVPYRLSFSGCVDLSLLNLSMLESTNPRG